MSSYLFNDAHTYMLIFELHGRSFLAFILVRVDAMQCNAMEKDLNYVPLALAIIILVVVEELFVSYSICIAQ